MRIFISHKLEDAATANLIAKELSVSQQRKTERFYDVLKQRL